VLIEGGLCDKVSINVSSKIVTALPNIQFGGGVALDVPVNLIRK
jgi:hypothetical protein